jgi:hypothetical protein
METAIEAEGNRLWGVLYALNKRDWERLDQWQDARLDGAGMYFHYPVLVRDMVGKRYEARLYKKDVLNEPRLPSECYMEHILEGARHNALPPTYIESLMAIKTAPAHYVVPLRPKFDFADAASDSCASCAGV